MSSRPAKIAALLSAMSFLNVNAEDDWTSASDDISIPEKFSHEWIGPFILSPFDKYNHFTAGGILTWEQQMDGDN